MKHLSVISFFMIDLSNTHSFDLSDLHPCNHVQKLVEPGIKWGWWMIPMIEIWVTSKLTSIASYLTLFVQNIITKLSITYSLNVKPCMRINPADYLTPFMVWAHYICLSHGSVMYPVLQMVWYGNDTGLSRKSNECEYGLSGIGMFFPHQRFTPSA